jgi:hypothetical protein
MDACSRENDLEIKISKTFLKIYNKNFLEKVLEKF